QRRLADAARDGLVVFAASGSQLDLLPDCRINGRYQYLGVTPQRQHVALADDAEVRINVASDSHEASPRAPLALDLVQVGTLATTRRSGKGAVLVGSCAAATHFARTLAVGETSGGTEGADRRAGCAAASPDDAHPPERCRRVLRAELVALRDATFD